MSDQTVEELVQILKGMTAQQRKYLASSGPPKAQAAAAVLGSNVPADRLVQVLREVLNSKLSQNLKNKTSEKILKNKTVDDLVKILEGLTVRQIETLPPEKVESTLHRIWSSRRSQNLKIKVTEKLFSVLSGVKWGAMGIVRAVKAVSESGLSLGQQQKIMALAPRRVQEAWATEVSPRLVGQVPPRGSVGSPSSIRKVPITPQRFSRTVARQMTEEVQPTSYNALSVSNLINAKAKNPQNASRINRALDERLKVEIRNVSYNPVPEKIKKYINYLSVLPKGNWKYDLIDIIRQKVSEINHNAASTQQAKNKLRNLRTTLGVARIQNSLGLSGTRQEITKIFVQAERNFNRRLMEEKKQKMNENRNRQGLPPLPNIPTRPVFSPPPNHAQVNLAPPPLNMSEQRAIENVGGENKALNLVQNAGGPNNVLRAANQLKEAGGDPVTAIARGANAKNVKIVLQLGGVNNATKVVAAVPKIVKRKKAKSRPRVAAIKKLLKSLPKKKLLAVLPAANKNAIKNKNKANVATRVTSYLTGRTKKK
jgi:hypothetical protein